MQESRRFAPQCIAALQWALVTVRANPIGQRGGYWPSGEVTSQQYMLELCDKTR